MGSGVLALNVDFSPLTSTETHARMTLKRYGGNVFDLNKIVHAQDSLQQEDLGQEILA